MLTMRPSSNFSSGSEFNLKHRRVKHYGYEFIYGINNVDKDRPLQYGIPHDFDEIMRRMMELGHVTELPDQLTVNQYEPGQGTSWLTYHRLIWSLIIHNYSM